MPNLRVQQVSRLLHRADAQPRTIWERGMVARSRQPFVTTSVANLRVAPNAKTSQGWKYPGGQVLRAPSTLINGRRYEDPKNPGQARRKQESNFFITINPNKAPEPGEEHDQAVRAMEHALRKLATDRAIAMYMKFGPVHAEYREDRYADVIHSTEFKSNVEMGSVMKRVHAHIWLTVHHYSQVQIDVKLLQHWSTQYYNEHFPVGHRMRITTKPHVHVKPLPQSDWAQIIKNYIHKGMMSADTAGPSIEVA